MNGLSHSAAGEGWEGILMPGETILWQGRPDPSYRFGGKELAGTAFGLVFAGFSAVWMLAASTAGGFFWTFGLIHFSLGVAMAIGASRYPPWRRKHTWYTLTDRRAFIATDMPLNGRKLKSWAIDADSEITYDGEDLATIHFAREFRQTKNGTQTTQIGFERIPDGAEVHRLISGIRDSRRAAETAGTRLTEARE